MSRWAILLAAACAGCYEPPDSCGIRCVTECPGDLTCVNGTCARPDGAACDGTQVELTQITLGSIHACGLDREGTAYCWGDNRDGELGNGLAERQVPRPVPLAGTWSAIAAGGLHTCALASGVAYCWGNNGDGQVLGSRGGEIPLPQKVQFGLATPPPFTKIVTGGNTSCALGEGQVFCWGDKRYVGVEAAPDVAVKLAGEDWTDVSLGADFGCGVTGAGIQCWGANDDAQIGLPKSEVVTTPRVVPGFPPGTISALEAGVNNACVVIDGGLWCWGDAEIMGGTAGTQKEPSRLGLETGWTQIAAGESTICGIRAGNAYCWGRTRSGETGAGLWEEDRARAAASDLGPADEIAITTRHIDSADRSVCMRTGFAVRCWGDNSFGQLGLGFAAIFDTPVEVAPPGGRTWAHISAGAQHACGTLDDGTVMCWGQNDVGAVDPSAARGRTLPCSETTCDATRPIPAPFATPDELVAGTEITCARTGPTIRCWGDNRDYRLGVTNPIGFGPTTLTAPSGTFVKLLPGSADAMCGEVDSNQIACWGEIGNVIRIGPTIENNPALFDVTSVGLGEHAACVVRDDGSRVCWGRNDAGQLGSGDTTMVASWTVDDQPHVLSISTRSVHSCAITEGQQVVCWGSNDREQSGRGLSISYVVDPSVIADATPQDLANCTATAVSRWHSCAVCGGRVSCWGENQFGELGRGTRSYTESEAAPIAIDPALSFVEVGTSDAGGCAVTTTGRMFCWGDSWRGQVGTGASAKNLPTPIAGAL